MKKYILSTAFLSLLITACSKSDFDPKVDEYLTDQRKEELKADVNTKASLLQVELNGIYNNNVAEQDSYEDSNLSIYRQTLQGRIWCRLHITGIVSTIILICAMLTIPAPALCGIFSTDKSVLSTPF